MRCKELLPLAQFSRNVGKKDGLEIYCKRCTSVLSAAHYQANKEKRRLQQDEWNRANPGKAAAYCAAWRQRNPGAQQASQRRWYSENRAEALAKDKARRDANLDAYRARERASYAVNREARAARHAAWRAANPHRVRALASYRRAAKKQRTPPWLTAEHYEQIVAVYERASWLTKTTGIMFHVDHIVPLQGKTVSGLHVPWNLECMWGTRNLSKNNRFVSE